MKKSLDNNILFLDLQTGNPAGETSALTKTDVGKRIKRRNQQTCEIGNKRKGSAFDTKVLQVFS